MKLDLDDEALRAIMREAIFTALGTEKRDALLKNALQSVLSEPQSTYDKTTRLEQAFREAVVQEVRQVCKEVLSTDEGLRVKIRDWTVAAIAKWGEAEDMPDVISRAMTAALNDRYRR